MKICMISYSSFFDSRVQRYARSLLQNGHTVDSICLGIKGKKELQAVYGIQPYPLLIREYNERSLFAYLKQMFSFIFLSTIMCTRLHFRKRYDIIHFHNVPDFGIFCTIIPKLMGAKIILDIHDILPEFYMRKFSVSENHISIRLLKWIEKISCSYADHVITVTELWRQRLIERSLKPDKCTVILNAPDKIIFNSQFKVKRNLKDQRFTLGYHGNFTEPTGIDIAIKAISIVKKSVPDIHFLIIGQGREENYLKNLSKTLGLKDYITFIESVPVYRIPRLMSKVDAGIDPKRDGVYSGETLSVKAMEYLAMEIPLIISKTKISQLYFDDSTVMFFQPDDEQDLAERIIELFRSYPVKSKKMIKNSKRFIQEYSWEKYQNSYLNLLNILVNQDKPGS